MVKTPGNGRLNNLNDPVLNVLSKDCLCRNERKFTKAELKSLELCFPGFLPTSKIIRVL